MPMSVKMAKSHARMMEHEKKLEAKDFPGDVVHIIHEEGSSYILYNSFLMHDPKDKDYIWVFCEHQVDLIFHKEELFAWNQAKR